MKRTGWRLTAILLMAAMALAALSFPATAATSEDNATLSDFAAFDRAFVPALALSTQGRVAPAQQALQRALAHWTAMQARLAEPYAADPRWVEEAGRVSAALDSAGKHLAAGKSQEAHEALESVRLILWQARDRHGVVYFGDLLTAYHEPMEAIALGTKGRTTLSDAELDRLSMLFAEARPLWKRVETFAFDPAPYGFDAKHTERLHALVSGETHALAALGRSLERRDVAAVLKLGPAIKPPFAGAVMLFGDFQGLQ
ncbi:MAG TPA: hypothetical protein VKB51_07955 [bacterium]|nr:hypothetical protein [bacterium]